MLRILAVAAVTVCLALPATVAQTTPLTGSHTDLPRWCGKAYEAGSPSFPPGGMLEPPAPQTSQLLNVMVQPRHSIYVSSESTGEFIVDAALSSINGQPYANSTVEGTSFDVLYFDIRIDSTDQLLVSNNASVGSTGNLYEFDLTALKPRMKPYPIVMYGGPMHGNQSFTATTELYYLPAKQTGSMVKIDNLNLGLLMANNVSGFAFEPILPFGFYTDCSGYLQYSLANVTAYKDLGYTGINPVCALTDGDLGYLFDWLDIVNMPFQYDMRGSFFNLTSVRQQVAQVKDYSALLSWYTADEPDGWEYAFEATTSSYNLLKQLDPYHPVSLVLNCQNYYFDRYTDGTDIIMEDAYPVGINATWSRPFDTYCNATHGDCGCDNCIGELQDVSNRLDDFYNYQTWLGRAQKPQWAVTQMFSGEGYWSRDPTQAEAWAMALLGINHRAKGIMSWIFPASDSLNQAQGGLARVVANAPVRDFVLGGQPTMLKVHGFPLLDVSYWTNGAQLMVCVVNMDYADTSKTVKISLPVTPRDIASQPWGEVTWSLAGNTLRVKGLSGVATSIVIVDT